MNQFQKIAAAWAVTQTINSAVITLATVGAVAFVVIGGGDLTISWGPK